MTIVSDFKDEIKYIWPQRRSIGKFLFLWIRYYTICLLLFDAVQIHVFARPGVPNDNLCVMIAPVARVLGAISLWSVEVIMQLRIYALFNRSRKIAGVNLLVFLGSIAAFLWILVMNAKRRRQMIVFAAHLPLPGCPVVNGGTEWALWIAPMVYEFILFTMVIYKALVSISASIRLNQRITLTKVLIQENVWYFFSVGFVLLFNNLMVINPLVRTGSLSCGYWHRNMQDATPPAKIQRA
ncbi:hypothetical protein CPB83DRAFT_596388 [Crepidotus variabilis]|uniref:DUF6533 domain-containing protein n=1 Tax=Crepidotus variabilis TaxID=179855 RepID=A0A9P6E988_9AGAR|nr:hypothetical protein CPB83DRAFT_596388 [Crepidotus variabilis]